MIDGQYYTSYYSHLASINVESGQNVTSNSVIGAAGNTGSSTGVHLHLSIARGRMMIDYNMNVMNNFTINPYSVMILPPRGESYDNR